MSSFLWEDSASPPASASATRQSHQSLPSLQDLAQGVPACGRPEEATSGYQRHELVRDSGNWSMPSQSKHSSAASFATNGMQLPALSSRTSPRDRLSAVSAVSTVSSDRSPHLSTVSYGAFSSLSEDGPSRLSHINQPFEPLSTTSTRDSADLSSPPVARPNSVNSRMNHLALTSPLASTNASQTSLVSGLQRDRGMVTDTANGHSIRLSGGVAPAVPNAVSPTTPTAASSISTSTTTTSIGRRVPGRTAPPIGVNPQTSWLNPNADNPTKGLPWAFPDPELGPNPNAMKPTKGMPWAFPDPELAARPSSKSDHDRQSQPASLRRDSIGGTSVASSHYTADSRGITIASMGGQRRLEDDSLPRPPPAPVDDGTQPMSLGHDGHPSSTLSGIGHGPHHHHHHHQLHHRQLTTLNSEPSSPAAGNTPYSRTPELRVSHKLAERKRRSEMKNLFEELRMILPSDGRVSKSSKWEILTKAIDYTKSLEQGRRASERKAEAYRMDAERCSVLQRENQELREELQRLRQLAAQHQHQQQPPPPSQPQPQPPLSVTTMPNGTALHHSHYHSIPPSSSPPRTALPPVPPQSTAMQGVQYSA